MIVARGGKRGKTAGRGGKGQSARAGNKRRPEWRDIIKKLPKLRGRGVNQNKPFQEKPVVINLSALEGAFAANDSVTPAVLIEKGMIATWSGNIPLVKILGEGDITKALKVSGCTMSESAKEKVLKAGGSFTAMPSRILVKAPTEAQTAAKAKKKAAPKKEKKEKTAAPAKEAKSDKKLKEAKTDKKPKESKETKADKKPKP